MSNLQYSAIVYPFKYSCLKMSHHLCGSNPSFLVAWNGNFGDLVPIGFFAAEVWIQANEEARLQRLAQRGSGVDAQLGRKMKLDFEAPGLSQSFLFLLGEFFVQKLGIHLRNVGD